MGKWDDVQVVYLSRAIVNGKLYVGGKPIEAIGVGAEPLEAEYELRLGDYVLTREDELEMREERLRAERQAHAELIDGPQAEVAEETPEAKTALGKILAWLVGVLGQSQQARRGEMIAGGSFMASRAMGIDITARYQPYIDWVDIQPFVDFVAIKVCEVDDTAGPESWRTKGALEQWDEAYKIGKPVLIYQMINTALWLNRQVDIEKLREQDNLPDDQRAQVYIEEDPQIRALLREWIIGEEWMTDWRKVKTAKKRAAAAYCPDEERYWRSYSDWYANGSNCAKVGDFWIKETVSRHVERVRWLMMRGYLPTVKILNYTGWWFTSTYSPSLGDWLCNQDVWIAAWYWNAGSVKTTWQGIKDLIAAIPDTWRPKYIYNDLPELVQISGDRFIPGDDIRNSNGIPRTVDINIAWMTKDEFYAWLGFTPVVPNHGGDDDGDEENPDLAALTQRVILLEASQEAMKERMARIEAWARSLEPFE
jgi:hypothetical protein